MNQTISEKIISQHAGKPVKAGDIAIVRVDGVMATDATAPFAIKAFRQMDGKKLWDVERVALIIDAALLAYLAGALMTLGFAPYHAWPVVFISLPLFYQLLMTRERRAQALWCGFFFGYGYFMAGTWWIGNALLVDAAKFGWMLPFSILGLSAVLALYFLPLAYAAYRLRTHMTPLLFAALWVGAEYLRSVGAFGFPWNLAGYIGLASLPFAQLAAWEGTFGLGFVIVAVGLLPVLWLGAGSKRPQIHPMRARAAAEVA